jgi:hypothetical protein
MGRKRRALLASCVVGLMLAGVQAAAPAQAAGTLDQSVDVPAYLNGYYSSASETIAQTFTAGRTGTLDRVDLAMTWYGGIDTAPEDLTLTVRENDGATAFEGTVLATETFASTLITGEYPDTWNWLTVNIDPGVAVTAGTTYALVLANPGSHASPMPLWVLNDQSLSSYSGGESSLIFFGGHYVEGGDVAFKTYVAATAVDADLDTYDASVDCDDTVAAINPGAAEVANDGIDQNCIGGDLVTYFADTDGDTYGDAGSTEDAEGGAPVGHVDNDDDCDDNDGDAYPGAVEVANDLIDQNCNDYDAVTYYTDGDADTYGSTSTATDVDGDQPAGTVTRGGDADDADATVNPGATDVCDGKDNNQDGTTDEGWPNADGDSLADCVDSDDDNDGLDDGEDPDALASLVSGTPTSALSAGNKKAFLDRLAYIDTMLKSDDTNAALLELDALRKRVDGCGNKADKNDWVTSCTSQITLRSAINGLITNISAS